MTFNSVNIKTFSLIILLVSQGCAMSSKRTKPQSCASVLPKEALNEIAKYFTGWRILEMTDLDVYDQTLWKKTHQRECPGIAVGNYDGTNDKEYAALVIPRDSLKRQVKVLLLKQNSLGKYTLSPIYKADTVGNYPVIYKGLPDTYSDFYDEDTKIEIKHDVIILEYVEASTTALYYKDGKYSKLLISD